MSAYIPLLLALAIWAAIPLASQIGWPIVTGAAIKLAIIQAAEILARKLWMTPAFAIYDWHSPDSWKWFVTSLVSSNVAFAAGHLATTAATHAQEKASTWMAS